MVDTKKLQKEEIEAIENNTNSNKVYDLEKLILDGEGAKIPVEITYPTKDGGSVQVGAMLKPLTDIETNNAMRALKKNKNTTFRNEILRRGLFTEEGEPFPFELIKIMYSGVAAQLADKLTELSGVQVDKESQKEFADELMGF